jgi:shikimate dehydrogenase
MDATTELYCLLGNPVAHSMSPEIHNSAFQKLGLNACYLAFKVEDLTGAMKGFRALGIKGASVTIPHKIKIMRFLDDIDPTAKIIGAVNTIVRDGERLVGYNTDGEGAVKALRDKLGDVKKLRVSVIGSGGAARAVAITLAVKEKVESINIIGIIRKEIAKLTRDIGENSPARVRGVMLNDENLKFCLGESDLLINASPVGMHPHVDKSPVKPALLRKELAVFDVVYNPLETKLIRDAKKAGAKTVCGVEMFINQAVLQFELWTAKRAPVELMRKIVLKKLGKK